MGLIDLVKVVGNIYFAEVSPLSSSDFNLSMCVGINIFMHVASLKYTGRLHSQRKHYERERERGSKLRIASKAW